MDKEVIFGEDLEKIFGKRPWGDTIELMAERKEEPVEEKIEEKEKEDNAVVDDSTDAAKKPEDDGAEKG